MENLLLRRPVQHRIMAMHLLPVQLPIFAPRPRPIQLRITVLHLLPVQLLILAPPQRQLQLRITVLYPLPVQLPIFAPLPQQLQLQNTVLPPLTFKTIMKQFPINLADAVTGHKLQGRTLDKIIITGWGLNMWRNWEYTVLSRVKTRKGFFLLEELDPEKSYGATQQFKDFIKRLKSIESHTIEGLSKTQQ